MPSTSTVKLAVVRMLTAARRSSRRVYRSFGAAPRVTGRETTRIFSPTSQAMPEEA